jgi:hypothetical protein
MESFNEVLKDYFKFETLLSFYQSSTWESRNGSLASVKTFLLSDKGLEAIDEIKNLILDFTLILLNKYSHESVSMNNDNISLGLVINYYEPQKGGSPLFGTPKELMENEKMQTWMKKLADRSFIELDFVSKPNVEDFTTFTTDMHIPMIEMSEVCNIFVYLFTIDNISAWKGQDFLSICFIIRSKNSDDLQKCTNAILDRMRVIRDLMTQQADKKIIIQVLENIRNFYTHSLR